MKDNLNIDELLNGFIDGELTERHRIEVQRLISHDPQIAKRLRELQRCKVLVSSLPRAEAPPDMPQRVSASLQAMTLTPERPSSSYQRSGARYLLARRVLAAAAMIGLVAVLGVMVYTVLVPERAVEGPVVAGDRPRSPTGVGPEIARPRRVVAEFYGRLELETADFARVDALVGRAIRENGLSDSGSPATPAEKGLYTLSCSPEALNLLLADLSDIWQKFDSATLFVETDQFGQQVVVDAVNVEQIAGIVRQDTLEKRIEVAKNYAVLNKMTNLLPGKELLAAINNQGPDLTGPSMGPIKPVLTWREETTKKLPSQMEAGRKVHLTIVIEGG